MRSYAILSTPTNSGCLVVMWPADARALTRPTSKAREKSPGDEVAPLLFLGFPHEEIFRVVICRWDTGTPSLYSWFSWIFLPYTKLNFQNPSLSKSCKQPTLSSCTTNFKESTEKIFSFVWVGRIRVWQILIGVIKMHFLLFWTLYTNELNVF